MPAFPGDQSAVISAALSAVPSGTPASEVARRLLDLFLGGSVQPGTRLPPERQLAATLGVGRSAVREALAALEILGIVDVRPGSGTYLRGTASELLPQTLRWGLLIGRQSTSELLELRAGLEIYIARLAASRGSRSGLARQEAALARMREAEEDLRAFAKADQDFHDALAATSGNDLLTDLLAVIRSLLRVYADRAVGTQAEARTAREEHEAIHAAVKDGDENTAAAAMATHMATATQRLAATDAS